MKLIAIILRNTIVVTSLLAMSGTGYVTANPQSQYKPVSPDKSVMTEAPLDAYSGFFVENAGQFSSDVRFQLRSELGALWVAEDALWITVLEHAEIKARPDHFNWTQNPVFDPSSRTPETLHGVNLRISFVGANRSVHLEPFSPVNTVVSYFIGNNANKWHTAVPAWAGIRYVDVYPNIDLELTATSEGWQAQMVAHPGADLQRVIINVEGASKIRLGNNKLRLTTAIGDYDLPLIHLKGASLNRGIAKPTLDGRKVISPFATVDSNPASIPLQNSDLVYSTYLGGTGFEHPAAIVVDATGAAYLGGETTSFDFPTTPGAFDVSRDGLGDIFVSKLNPTGSGLIYSAFLGGSGSFWGDRRGVIAIDTSGNAYVTGYTDSPDFPTTTGAFQTTYNGGICAGNPCKDSFATKINQDGSGLVFSTFLGGTADDIGNDIAIGGDGAVYVVGSTGSPNFPTTLAAFQTTYGGGASDAFVVKLGATGSYPSYSTFLGGNSQNHGETASALAVDSIGQAYVTGEADSYDFPTTPGAFKTALIGYPDDGFVTKLNASGSGLVYSTFLGGSFWYDGGTDIAIDSYGQAFVTGPTASYDFPTTPGAFQPNCTGCPNTNVHVYVTKLNSRGNALVYSTFLTGSSFEGGQGIAIKPDGTAFVTGFTFSPDFPITPDAFQTVFFGNDRDGFITEINPTGSGLVYSSFLGGDSWDYPFRLAMDQYGAAYIIGETDSVNFPITPGAFQTTNFGFDAFVTKLLHLGLPDLSASTAHADPLLPQASEQITFTIHLVNLGEPAPNVVVTVTIPNNTDYVPNTATASQGTVTGSGPLVYDVGMLVYTMPVTITFASNVHSNVISPTVLSGVANVAWAGGTLELDLLVIANGLASYLPIISHSP